MGLREIESTLPPGFRFYPSDEELVCHYLYKKVSNQRAAQGTLVEVDLHAREPWELPEAAKLTASEWYFFSFRDRKYATGSRTNRATRSGYWKATGKDREVRSPARRGGVVGMRKTLVFYRGRAPNGVKSCWVMHEFRLDSPRTQPKEDWVLCRVFQKRKDSEQDNNGGSSSWPWPLAGSSSSRDVDVVVPPPDQGSMTTMDAAAYTDDYPEIGEDQLFDGAIWQYSPVDLDVDHYQHTQDVMSSSPLTTGIVGSRGVTTRTGGDGCGFFYDTSTTGGFEDTNLAGMGLPQGWMG